MLTKELNTSSCSREHWKEGRDELVKWDDTTVDITDAGVAASELERVTTRGASDLSDLSFFSLARPRAAARAASAAEIAPATEGACLG